MSTLQQFFSPELVRALGLTLLHSLWQGALVAIVLAGLLLLLQRYSALLRYWLSVGALATTLVLAVVTFSTLYQPTDNPSAGTFRNATITTVLNTPVDTAADPVVWVPAQLTQAAEVLQPWLPLIVLGWLGGLLFVTLRFMGSLAYVHRLRHLHISPLEGQWTERIEVLRLQLGISKPVEVLESALVKVPVVVGALKPAVLIPFGTFAGLTPEQVEAILAHELAHIQRHDFLVNLLQSLVELLFFFHPAVWWIGECVRTEREHCCDDRAISVCGSPVVYARALAALDELTVPGTPALALSALGRKGTLLGRIKRLLSAPALKPSFSEGFLAASLLMISILTLSLSAAAALRTDSLKQYGPLEAVATSISKALPAAAPDLQYCLESPLPYFPDSTVREEHDIVIVKNKKGKVTELIVDGREIPENEIKNYLPLVEERSRRRGKTRKLSKGEEEETRVIVRRAMTPGREADEHAFFFHDFDFSELPSMPPMPPMAPMPGLDNLRMLEQLNVPMHTPPVPPVAPVPPVPPVKKDTKALHEYEKQLKEFNSQLKEFEKERQEYEKERKEMEKAHEELRKDHSLMEKEHRIMLKEHADEAHSSAEKLRKEIEREIVIVRPEGSRVLGAPGMRYRTTTPLSEKDRALLEKELYLIRKNGVDVKFYTDKNGKVDKKVIKRKLKKGDTYDSGRVWKEGGSPQVYRFYQGNPGKEGETFYKFDTREKIEVRERQPDVMPAIKEELVKDKLIGGKDKNYEFEISDSGLKVNGKAQSQASYEKYKKLMDEKGHRFEKGTNFKFKIQEKE